MGQADALLAESSGVAIIERGALLYIIDRGTRGLYTAGFVGGLIAVIVGITGLVQLVLVVMGAGGILPLGAIALTIGALAGMGLWRVVVTIRKRRALPLEQLTALAIVDRQQGILCNPAGQPLAPLASVSLSRKMQLASSSPVLQLSWPGGALCVVRGNPFAGGIDAVEAGLRQVLGQRG